MAVHATNKKRFQLEKSREGEVFSVENSRERRKLHKSSPCILCFGCEGHETLLTSLIFRRMLEGSLEQEELFRFLVCYESTYALRRFVILVDFERTFKFQAFKRKESKHFYCAICETKVCESKTEIR